jgi:hypothetical protein
VVPCHVRLRTRSYLAVFEILREKTTSTIIDRLLNRNASGTSRVLRSHRIENRRNFYQSQRICRRLTLLLVSLGSWDNEQQGLDESTVWPSRPLTPELLSAMIGWSCDSLCMSDVVSLPMRLSRCLALHSAKGSLIGEPVRLDGTTPQRSKLYQMAERGRGRMSRRTIDDHRKTFLQPRREWSLWAAWTHWIPAEILHRFISPLTTQEGSSLLYHRHFPSS